MATTVKLYPPNTYNPPPTHFNKDIVDACEKIHKSLTSFVGNKNAVIELLADKPAAKRNEIFFCYNAKYDGKDLDKAVDDKFGGDLGVAMTYLCLPIHYAEARMVHDALSGIGAREHLLYPILCGRDNQEILKLKTTYFELYQQDLGVKLASELSGDFERLIFWSLQGCEVPYDGKVHTHDRAQHDADAFYKAGQGKFFGTDEASLFKVIASSPPRHLEEVNKLYIAKHERTLISALEYETGGYVEQASTFAVGIKLKPYVTVAKYLHERMAGFGTDEDGLTCALIRYQSILSQVSEAYEKEYGKNLLAVVKSEVGGKYETLLVSLIENARR